ncbi:uncharacterized protein LOC133792429 [Humulus lupulus]|uniref:uncharacterized protein LOC133792429 n=1 Tax=Humulus lupulus TaxID=3486 RepID=UPI002B40111A|nr:uncharacterized protein LOC133792429 [Humulus lupulus]
MADTDEEIELQSASIATYFVQHYYTTYIEKTPCMNSSQTGHMWLMEILKGHESRCYSMFRMEKDVFIKLCDELEANYGFKGSKRMCALEILDVLKPPDPEFKDVPEEILKDSRYMPHFKNCIGAIDGVHVNAIIPPEDQVPFVGRKGIPTQNVMAICNFDMQFIYAYAGWEGSAHDTRIFYTALRDSTSNFPKPPQGKYYLVDAGYPQITGFLGPYKGQRYHLPQFQRGSKPTGYKEVFNQAHSSLRSVIERTFGVWKKRWKILRDMPSYPYQKQVKIVIASMTLHNYIRRHAKRDRHFEKIRDNPYYCVEDQTNIEDEDETARASNLNEMDNTRDLIAASLMRYN